MFPILVREFRIATRKRRTYWIRLIAAALAVAMSFWMLHGLRDVTAGPSVGRTLFFVTSFAAFLLCLIAGSLTTAVCLQEDRNTRMIELLSLTKVPVYQIVLGKLANASILAVQFFMGCLPVLALSLALGGVSAGEFGRMVMTLSATLLFSLTAGMLASTLTRRYWNGILATLLFVGTLLLSLKSIDAWLLERMQLNGHLAAIIPGPWQMFRLTADSFFDEDVMSFQTSVLFTITLAFGLLILTCFAVARMARDREYSSWFRRWRLLLPGWLVRSGRFDSRQRRAMLRQNPALWLASRQRWQTLGPPLLIVAIALIWGMGWRIVEPTRMAASFLGLAGFVFVIHTVAKLVVVSKAAAYFSFEHTPNELELLLVTPLRIRKLCDGFLESTRRFCKPLIGLVLVLDVAVLGVAELIPFGSSSMAVSLWLTVWALIVMLFIDLYALHIHGLWEGLIRKKYFPALSYTVLKLMVVPSVVFLVTLPFVPFVYLFEFMIPGPAGILMGAVFWWWLVGFLVSAHYHYRTRSKINRFFRQAATEDVVALRRIMLAAGLLTLSEQHSRSRPSCPGSRLSFRPDANKATQG